jgi:hypothetical protein
VDAVQLALARFRLAQALWAARRDRRRAEGLARTALDALGAAHPLRAEIARWLGGRRAIARHW